MYRLRSLTTAATVTAAVICAGSTHLQASEVPDPVPSGAPQNLSIPKLGVHSYVESVSLTKVSDKDAPYRWGDVAWYNRGARPGEVGRAAIYGHLDSTCCPAVFYQLKTLRKGDIVYVNYRHGQLGFRVQWSRNYWNNQLPLNFIFGPAHERGLSLITCSGAFHRDGTGYDHKLVVYATLIGPHD